MKKEFDSIQLIDRIENWEEDISNNTYTALRDDASIFAYFETAKYKSLIFKKDQSFEIDGDFIIYDELTVREGVI